MARGYDACMQANEITAPALASRSHACMEDADMSVETISPKAVAAVCDTTQKRIRAFIRAQAEKGTPITTPDGLEILPVGSGASYAFTRDEAKALISAFNNRPRTSDRRSPAVVKADVAAWLDEADDDDEANADDDDA